MSLIVDGQLTTLASDIYALMQTPIDLESKTKAQIEDAAKARIKGHMDLICDYLIQYMKIKGIQVQLDSGTVETFAGGTGDHGSSLYAAAYPVTGTVNVSSATTGVQKSADETTGHIE